jgi:hypothetical protein
MSKPQRYKYELHIKADLKTDTLLGCPNLVMVGSYEDLATALGKEIGDILRRGKPSLKHCKVDPFVVTVDCVAKGKAKRGRLTQRAASASTSS